MPEMHLNSLLGLLRVVHSACMSAGLQVNHDNRLAVIPINGANVNRMDVPQVLCEIIYGVLEQACASWWRDVSPPASQEPVVEEYSGERLEKHVQVLMSLPVLPMSLQRALDRMGPHRTREEVIRRWLLWLRARHTNGWDEGDAEYPEFRGLLSRERP